MRVVSASKVQFVSSFRTKALYQARPSPFLVGSVAPLKRQERCNSNIINTSTSTSTSSSTITTSTTTRRSKTMSDDKPTTSKLASYNVPRESLHDSILDCIGKTPIVKLNRMAPVNDVNVYVKLESGNPGGSLKDRLAYGTTKRVVVSPLFFSLLLLLLSSLFFVQ